MLRSFVSNLSFFRKVKTLSKQIEIKSQHDMTNVLQITNDSVLTAVKLLQKGDVIAIPTDTVYGLAVDSRNCDAIQELYNIKGRNFNKPVAICVGNVKDISVWGNISYLPEGLLENLLPGPVTVILKRTHATSLKLNPGVDNVGIRVPDNSFVRDIVINFGFAIALTSANISNSHSTLNPNEFKSLWPRLGAVFDGGTLSSSNTSRAGSTIIDLTEPGFYKIVREGGFDIKRSEAAIIKDSLSSDLTNCVKNVEIAQKTSSLSQEIENSLCTVLEAIFMHGLRESLADRMSSVLGDPDQRPSPEFWSLVMIFSHSEVIKQINHLSQITTDVGRSRAWIRLSLNDGMFVSYLTMIRQDNSALSPYFKRYAFLRDLELLSTTIHTLQDLNQFTFSLPVNSSVLNTWPNAPLLLAGMWTPPMKNVPVSYGMDIVKGIVDDVEEEKSALASTYSGSSGTLYKEEEEEAALRIILNTPIEGSPLQTRMYMDESKEGEKSYTGEGHLDPQYSKQFPAEGNDGVKEDENKEETVELSDVIVQEEEKNTTLESYHKIIDSYNVASEDVRKPDLEDIIRKFGPSENKNKIRSEKKLSPKSPANEKTFIAEDFEVIEESSVPHSVPEFKFLMEQLGKLMHERGLIQQNFSCKDCGQLIGFSFAKACVCHLTGCYYCEQCFKSTECALPSKILHNWDFSLYPVSGRAAEFLKDVHEFPIMNVRRINPHLYFFFPEMLILQKLRSQLNFIRIYLYTCHDDIKERLKRLLWPREYLYEHIHLYAIADLLDIPNGKLADLLKRAIKMSIDHVLACQLCSQKGYICEVCNNDKVIYPFDIDTTYRCPVCRTVYHLACKKEICPKCDRIKKRKACLET